MRRAYLTLFAAVSLSCSEDAARVGEVRSPSTSDAAIREAGSSASKPDGGKPESSKLDSGSGVAELDAAAVELPSEGLDATVPAPEVEQAPVEEPRGTLPCDVQGVLAERCWTCHGAALQGGAPMALTTLAELRTVSPRAGVPYYQALAERVERSGSGMMPPAGQPPLSEAQLATLRDWVARSAPSGDACSLPSEPPAPAEVDAGMEMPAPEGDCDVSFELRATDGQGGAFPVPLEDDHYQCFYFRANIDAGTLATRLTPILDKTSVLHHWLLFAADNENEAPSGTQRQCSGIHPGAYLMAAWLPGTPELVMPDDVGMEMPTGPSAQFILENHYNNIARHQGMRDDSGVKVCATRAAKGQHAAIHWLGSELISLAPGSAGSASGTCTPKGDAPIHILGVVPHMHKLGTHVNMTILRADGSTETLHEGPFAFESQGYYPKDVVLQAGDRVTTRCDYQNTSFRTVSLGEQTGDEMCYMFTLAYPVGLMNTGGDFLNPLTGQPFVQGPNRCMR